MKYDNKQLDDYLEQVRINLGNHPEAEEIIQELRAHIWDFANNVSRQDSVPVDEAFALAIESMEDPEIIAESFKEDLRSDDWLSPRSPVPERMLSNKDFFYLSLVGLVAASILISIMSIFSGLTGLESDPINYFTYLVQFLFFLILILGFLYFRNQSEFNRQLHKLHQRFAKFEKSMQDKEKKASMERAFSMHFEGLFELIFTSIFYIWLLYVTFINRWVIFTDLWYDFVVYIVILLGGIEIFKACLKLFVGEIRLSRLIYGISGIFSVIGSILILVFYPFDLTTWFSTLNDPSATMLVNWIQDTYGNPDNALRFLIGIGAVFQIMSSVYDLIKFGNWKTSDQKSLTVADSGQD